MPRQLVAWGVVAMVLIAGGLWWGVRERSGTTGGQPIGRLTTSDFHSLAFAPSEPDTVYFGHHNGLMVSRDGGRTWQPSTLRNADAMALAAPIADPSSMYAAGHDVFYKSSDGGTTWQPVTTNLPGTDVHGFTVDPQDADHVFAHVAGFGIWASQDGGTTWVLLSSDVPGSTFNLAIGDSAETLFAAAGEAGLWRSDDGGKAWSPISALPGDGAVAVAYDAEASRLYATTLGDGAGLFASNDGGTTWTATGLKGTLLALAISPHDSERLLVVDDAGRVFASRNAGATWPAE